MLGFFLEPSAGDVLQGAQAPESSGLLVLVCTSLTAVLPVPLVRVVCVHVQGSQRGG